MPGEVAGQMIKTNPGRDFRGRDFRSGFPGITSLRAGARKQTPVGISGDFRDFRGSPGVGSPGTPVGRPYPQNMPGAGRLGGEDYVRVPASNEYHQDHQDHERDTGCRHRLARPSGSARATTPKRATQVAQATPKEVWAITKDPNRDQFSAGRALFCALRSLTSGRYGRWQMTSENRRGEMVLFPLQLTVPPPPKLSTDKRQVRFLQIIDNLAAQTNVAMVSANVTEGSYASAVDLGALQSALLEWLARFSHAQIESR